MIKIPSSLIILLCKEFCASLINVIWVCKWKRFRVHPCMKLAWPHVLNFSYIRLWFNLYCANECVILHEDDMMMILLHTLELHVQYHDYIKMILWLLDKGKHKEGGISMTIFFYSLYCHDMLHIRYWYALDGI